tara:strand:- start:1357 stop:6144 length:4788 start_codon:yes stop_codon:yes gene_type:complete
MANAFDNLTRLFQSAAHEYGTKPLQEQARTAQIIDQNNLREATTKSATKYNLELKSIRQRMDAGEFDDDSGSLNLEAVQQARITARDEFEQSLPDYTSREHLNYRDENWSKIIESNKQNVISSVVSQTELQENDFDIRFQEQRIINNANEALTEAMSIAFQGGSRDQVEAELNRGYRFIEQPTVSMAFDGTLTPTSVNIGDEVLTREKVRKGILLRPDTEMSPIAKYKLASQYEASEIDMTEDERNAYLASAKSGAQNNFKQNITDINTAMSNISPLAPKEERVRLTEFYTEKLQQAVQDDPWLMDRQDVNKAYRDLNRTLIKMQKPSLENIDKAFNEQFEGRLELVQDQLAAQEITPEHISYPSHVLKNITLLEDGTHFINKKTVEYVNDYFQSFLQKIENNTATEADRNQAYELLKNYGILIGNSQRFEEFNDDIYYNYANKTFGPASQISYESGFSPAGMSPTQIFGELHEEVAKQAFYSPISVGGGGASGSTSRTPLVVNNQASLQSLHNSTVKFLPDELKGEVGVDFGNLNRSFSNHPDALGIVFLTTQLMPNTFGFRESDHTSPIAFDKPEQVLSFLNSRGYTESDISRFSRFLSEGDTEVKMREILSARRSGDFNTSEAAKKYGLYERDGVIVRDTVVADLYNGGLNHNGRSAEIAGKLVIASQLNLIDPERWAQFDDEQRLKFIESIRLDSLDGDSYRVYHYGSFVGRGNVSDPQNPFFQLDTALTITQDGYKSILDNPIASQYEFPRVYDDWSFGEVAFSAFRILDTIADASTYIPGLITQGIRPEVTEYFLGTGLFSEDQINYVFDKLPDTGSYKRTKLPGFGYRAYGPANFSSEDQEANFSFKSVKGPLGEATVAEIINPESSTPFFVEIMKEEGLSLIEGRGFMGTDQTVGITDAFDALYTDPGLRANVGSKPQGARFLAAIDHLFGKPFIKGRALFNQQSKVTVEFANLFVAQNPELFDGLDSPPSVLDVLRAADKKNKEQWIADGKDIESFPSELDILAALDVEDYLGENTRSLAAIPSIAHTHLRHFLLGLQSLPQTLPENMRTLNKRLHLQKDAQFVSFVPPVLAEAESARYQAALNEVTNGLGVFGSANEINDMIRENALIAENSLILPYRGTETVRETMDSAIDAMRGVGTGTPVNAALPLDTPINMRDALGPFLDGELEEGIKVNVTTGDGKTTGGMITVVKDADTINTVVNYTDAKGNDVSVELTGRLKGLKAAEVFDEHFRRGKGDRPYSEVGGKEATRFFAAVLNASGEHTTVVLSGEKGTFGRELIDVKLGPKGMDWTELATSLGIGQFERRFAVELPDFANQEVTPESVEEMRKQFLAEVDTWQNARVYNAPQSGTKIFPTSHPYVTNEEGGTSNVRLSTYEQNDIHYVVPAMVDGEMIDDPFGVARRKGLHNYPSFRTAEEALRFSKEQHGNITPDGIWLPTSKPSPENESAVIGSMFRTKAFVEEKKAMSRDKASKNRERLLAESQEVFINPALSIAIAESESPYDLSLPGGLDELGESLDKYGNNLFDVLASRHLGESNFLRLRRSNQPLPDSTKEYVSDVLFRMDELIRELTAQNFRWDEGQFTSGS